MKANEFVKKHGLDEVKKILQCAPDFALSILDDGDETDLCDLKRLIDSHEIVDQYGGLVVIKECVDKTIFPLSDRIARMKQAISDVEACQ